MQVDQRERSKSSMTKQTINQNQIDLNFARTSTHESNFKKLKQLRKTPSSKRGKRNYSELEIQNLYFDEDIKPSSPQSLTGQQFKNILQKYKQIASESIEKHNFQSQFGTFSTKFQETNNNHKMPSINSQTTTLDRQKRSFSTVKERTITAEESERGENNKKQIQSLTPKEQTINNKQSLNQKESIQQDFFEQQQQNSTFTLNPIKEQYKNKQSIESQQKQRTQKQFKDITKFDLNNSLLNLSSSKQNLQDNERDHFKNFQDDQNLDGDIFIKQQLKKRSLTPKIEIEKNRIPIAIEEKSSIQSKNKDSSLSQSNSQKINKNYEEQFDETSRQRVRTHQNQTELDEYNFAQNNQYIEQKSLILQLLQQKQKTNIKNQRYQNESTKCQNAKLNIEDKENEENVKYKAKKRYLRRIAQTPEFNELILIDSNQLLQQTPQS